MPAVDCDGLFISDPAIEEVREARLEVSATDLVPMAVRGARLTPVPLAELPCDRTLRAPNLEKRSVIDSDASIPRVDWEARL